MRCIFVCIIFIFYNCASAESLQTNAVKPGACQLNTYLPLLQNKVVGIVANSASKVGDVHLIDTLFRLNALDENSIEMKTVFSPEHGFSGTYDAGAVIDEEGGVFDSLELVSLYGANYKPKASDLQGIDIMLFDLQDVGVRFYTYISTLHYVMQACAEQNIPLVVLDRPNPHMHYIDGPVMEEAHKSFVGMHEVPIVYGMSIGEYALMINGEGWLGNNLKCDLTVVKSVNFSRLSNYEFKDKPSPNLPNMRSIYLYPSLCLFEGTVMSIGRGTAFPFQVVGHPDFPDTAFSFVPVSTPGASLHPKLEDKRCFGYQYQEVVLDSLRYSEELDLQLFLNVAEGMGLGDEFFIPYFKLLVGTTELQKQVVAGMSEKEIRASWKPGLDAFELVREKYLLYN